MLAKGPAVLLRIYTEEDRRHAHRPLYEAVVMKARELGLAGATVLRGPMGFGHSQAIHTAKILNLSFKLPLVIEIVDAQDKIDALLAALEPVQGIGLVTTEKVEVVRYGEA